MTVDVWEKFYEENLFVELGSDQTSLHNPWAGGYYPVGFSYEESNKMMAEQPDLFKEKVQQSLRRQASAINNPPLDLREKVAEAYTQKYANLGYSPSPEMWENGVLYEIRLSKALAWKAFMKDSTKFEFV